MEKSAARLDHQTQRLLTGASIAVPPALLGLNFEAGPNNGATNETKVVMPRNRSPGLS